MTTTTVDEYFLIKPNWDSGISFKKGWRTSLQTSINNRLKRSALRTWPTRILTFNVDAQSYEKAAYIKRIIYKNLKNVWGVPYWQDESVLSSQASSLQKILNIDSSQYRNYEVGGECIIYVDENSYEVGVIESKTDTQITLVGNLVNTWPSGTSVYPILKARIRKKQNISFNTDQKSYITIEAAEEYDEITRNVPSIAEYPTFKNYPLFDVPPDWTEPIDDDQISDYSLLQYLGKSREWSTWDENEFQYKSDYFGRNKLGVQNVIDFFDYHQGRWGAFWRPSWISDVVVTDVIGASDIVIPIKDIKYSLYWQDNNVGEWLIFIWPDNSYEIRGVVRTIDSTHIQLNTSLGKEITVLEKDSMIISFLTFCHFNQDEIDVKLITDSLADFSLSFKTASFEQPFPTTTTSTTTTTTTSTSSTSSTTSSTASSTSTTSSTVSSTTTNTQSTTSSTTSSTASSTSTTASFTTTTASFTTTTLPGDIFSDTVDDIFSDTVDDIFSDT